jgi:hypothetical protein
MLEITARNLRSLLGLTLLVAVVPLAAAACGDAQNCLKNADGDCFRCGHLDGAKEFTECPRSGPGAGQVCSVLSSCGGDCEGVCFIADD